ncbi:MAG: AsmA family protein [Gammaproteobacteria bacterium]
MSQAKAETGRKPMARGLKIVLYIVGALISILLIALVILLTFDWNRARPWLNAKTSEAIERPFEIAGNLSVRWEKPADAIADRERSWRDYIPWPHLVANDIRVGNPAGLANQAKHDMARVRQFSFSLNPFALLHKTINIPVLRFDSPTVELLRTEDGSNNWTFKREEKQSKWELDLERIVLTKGVVHLQDAVGKADVTADVDTIEDKTYGVVWKLHGTYNGAPLTGSGKTGAVLSLKDQKTPFPILVEAHAGSSHLGVEGTVTTPSHLSAVDVKLKLGGPSMARLFPYTGVLLPETPAYSTHGRLVGAIGEKSSRWTYDNFSGKVGSSDIAGTLAFQTGKPRPKLTGHVHSKLLQLSDLGPSIGADSNESKEKRGVEAVQPSGKVLPVEEFKTERWTAVDADVKFSAGQIVRQNQLPIRKLDTHILMNDGVLTLAPLNFDMAGGNLSSNIKLDGSGRQGKNAIKATAKIAARHIKIKELFPKIDKMPAAVGEINGDASLSATGKSVATLLAASNGELKALISQGSVSKLMLEAAGLNVGNIVLTKLFGDKQIELNCMAADFDVVNGVAKTQTFVVDTEEAVITANGTINLASEQLDIRLKPETKALRIFSLRSPLYVKGPFSKPDVSVDKGVLALKAGGAIALGLAAPAAALLPLINAGPGKDSPCGKLLAEAREKPVAPPPGKTKR